MSRLATIPFFLPQFARNVAFYGATASFFALAFPTLAQTPPGPPPNPALAEAAKAEDRIGSVRRDTLAKYEQGLAELQLQFQKAADLEGALAVRDESRRMADDSSLTDKDVVSEPRALKALQQAMLQRMIELSTSIVQETMPRLVEFKRQFTMAGRLDEAVTVRTAIERLQNAHVPVARVKEGNLIAAETMILAYQSDRQRADKTYKGQKIRARGIVVFARVNPDDPNTPRVYLSDPAGTGWLTCHFGGGHWKLKEDRSTVVPSWVLTNSKSGGDFRFAKGNTIDVSGVADGFDEGVRLVRCDFPK
jgi:hypothetical protein